MQRLLIALAGSLLGCGASPGAEPRNAESAQSGEVESADYDLDDPLANVDDVETSGASSSCHGDTCTTCGESVCLEGFYCDEVAQACSWLPQCASDDSCKCIEAALPHCECKSRDGGTFVTCN